jgi:N-acyl-D-amino-acid deacylase
MFDTLIRGGTIIDGSGAPGQPGDVGVTGDHIAVVGDLSTASAASILQAEGLVVCPGFIDVHTHSDLTPLADPRCASKVRQGVTTELVGHCGISAFPLERGTAQEQAVLENSVMMGHGLIEADWSDCAGYLEAIERARPAFNMATLVSNGTIRSAVIGFDNRPPTTDELKEMRRQVDLAMEQGAFGLSSGLTLYPSSVAQTDELVALCEQVARWDGLYISHVRHIPGWHFKSVEEAIEIGRRSGAAVQVAHLFLGDPRHWGEGNHLIEMIENARREGLDVTFDAYPYLAAGCPVSELTPRWVQDGGTEAMLSRLADPAVVEQAITDMGKGIPRRWDKIVVAYGGPYGDPAWKGKTIAALADDAGVSSEAMLFRLLIQSRDIGKLIVFNRVEEDVQQFVSHPLGMIGSDGIAIAADGPLGKSLVHPRFYGTFPRVLSVYVRERKALTLEQAIRKMSALTAERLGLKNRGLLKEGYAADLVIFNPTQVRDLATFEDPHQYPQGISHVMVNGQWVVKDGELTAARPGQVLRHQAHH